MNKFISKIIGATLAFAMMIGGAVGINAFKEAKEVNADSGASFSVATYATANSWSDGTAYSTVNYDSMISLVGKTNGNNSKYYSSNKSWRHYEGDSGTITINAATGATLTSATFTFSYANKGCLVYDDTNYNSGGEIDLSGLTSAVIGVGHTSGTKNGNVQITAIVISYEVSSSAPVVDSVSATMNSDTYYTGSTLSASDFSVTATWTEGKADTHPTEGFTWTVNGVANGVLQEGDNAVVVTYANVSSDPFNVVGTTIHATSVEINHDTVTFETIGETLALSASITPANAVETVSWSTSDEAVATVDDNGEVTAVAAGTATITATAGSVSDICEVTVYNRSKATISFGKKDYNIAKPTETQDEISNALIDGYDFNLLNAHNSGATYEYIMFATNNLGTEESLVANKTAIPGAITRIVFNIRVGSSGKAIYNAILSNSSVTTTVSDSTHTRTGAGTLTIEADPSSNYHFFAISCVTAAGNGQLASIDVFYVPTTVKADFHALETQTTLSYRYEKNAQDEFSYSDISIRFGALVSKNLWDEINTIYDVAGFGVMIASGNTIKDFETFEDYAEFAVPADQNPNIASELIDYYVENDGTFEIPLSNNSYYWNLRFSIPESDMHVTYTAAAYIKIGSEIIFMQKARESVETLALDYLQNRGCDATTAGGSLKNIVDQSQMS